MFGEGILIFLLAAFVGLEVIARVPPLLHAPLLSATNAISGIAILGAIAAAGGAVMLGPVPLGAVAVALAAMNIAGGFLATDRMLRPLERKPEAERGAGGAPAGWILADPFVRAAWIARLLLLLATGLVYWGMRRLRDPGTARRGNGIAAWGVLLAIVGGLCHASGASFGFILGGLAVGGGAGAWLALRAPMIRMPQLVALLNGSGALASAIVGIVAYLVRAPLQSERPLLAETLCILVGAGTFAGSMAAAARLQGWIDPGRRGRGMERVLGTGALAIALALAGLAALSPSPGGGAAWAVFAGAGAWGLLFALPIGVAEMPIAIALLNALSGLAASFAGFAIDDAGLIAVGAIVAASGMVLARAMCRAMDRSLAAVLRGGAGRAGIARAAPRPDAAGPDAGISMERAVAALTRARSVLIVPGYGMAAARAQREVRALADLLEAAGKGVRFGVHPVAGREAGQVRALLEEAGVPHEKLDDPDAANLALPKIDAALVVGACDVVNPAAREARGTPLYGMPVLEVDWAGGIIVCNLDRSPGYSGMENPLYELEKTVFIAGDARGTVAELVRRLR